ncbi:MAG TPA: monofunctional biosynthetic peptidoglycan transglycosylase [Solimonas sp.]
MDRKEPSLDSDANPPLRPARGETVVAARPRRRKGSLRRWFWGLLLFAVLFIPVSVLLLRWLPPPTTAFMLQSPKHPVQYEWVPASRIAEVARKAVVASEDQKFWDHNGFDLEAIEKARKHNKKSKKRRGASTISQQTAKNLFLWSGGGYFRKGVEAGITVLMEALWPKQRILEVYLNIAEFGPGIYGVEAASQAYFNKPAAKLSANEAARLAAVLPSPRRWGAKAPGPYVQKRVRWIMGQMGYGARVAEPEPPPPVPGEPAEAEDESGFFGGDAPTPEATVPAGEAPAAEPAVEGETPPGLDAPVESAPVQEAPVEAPPPAAEPAATP